VAALLFLVPLSLTLNPPSRFFAAAFYGDTMPLEIASREAGDNRAYLSFFNKDAANTVMVASDTEYDSPAFSTASGGRPVYPQSEAWEQPGAVPGNAYWAWTLSGTALLNIQEG
jgi:hypothetical protein